MSKGSSVCGFGERKSSLDSWFSSLSSVEGAGMSWGRWAGLVMVKDKHGQGEGTGVKSKWEREGGVRSFSCFHFSPLLFG